MLKIFIHQKPLIFLKVSLRKFQCIFFFTLTIESSLHFIFHGYSSISWRLKNAVFFTGKRKISHTYFVSGTWSYKVKIVKYYRLLNVTTHQKKYSLWIKYKHNSTCNFFFFFSKKCATAKYLSNWRIAIYLKFGHSIPYQIYRCSLYKGEIMFNFHPSWTLEILSECNLFITHLACFEH